MAHREGPEFRELETGREREAWRQIKLRRQWMETSRLKRWRNGGGEALRPALPPPCPSSLSGAGGRARADAAERTSVPMETAEVGEGSQAQLVSLQGDSRAGDAGG